jgi:DNA adenine methylase
MKPPIAYFGGKSRIAPWLVAMFPPHRVYVEPFMGSAAILLAKPPSIHEVVNDRDGDVVNFFRVLRDEPAELERVCRLTPYARDEYDAAQLVDGLDDLERARRWWVRSSQSFGQIAQRTGWSTSVSRGANNARSAWNRIERFAPVAERMARCTIENGDALDVIVRNDKPDAVIYCDPPYLGSTRTSFADGRRPHGDYVHEFSTDDDHRRLAKILQEVTATVFVSGYPSPLYDDELYAGWARTEQGVLARASNGRKRDGASGRLEVVWSNRPITGTLW